MGKQATTAMPTQIFKVCHNHNIMIELSHAYDFQTADSEECNKNTLTDPKRYRTTRYD